MCGIAAFSSPEGSNLNARLLAHHLLTAIESRGSHASGFAYSNADGTVGMYKNPTPGSQLSLHELPRDAKTVIMHTRYATQGSPQDNRNNHPVVSTDRRIALVHNGVISNDHRLREPLGMTDAHGEVDSLVIPSLLAQQGIDGLAKLSGYAAIAWIDTSKPGLLQIAKLKQSPVAYTWLHDGTFVMASTPILLERAIEATGYGYGGVFELAESKMISVNNGFIHTHDRAPSMTYDYASYQRHSTATSGGPKSASTTTTSTPSGTTTVRGTEDKPKVYMPAPDDKPVDVDAVMSDLDEWRARRAEEDAKIAGKAMAMLSGPEAKWDDGAWDEYMRQLEEREEAEASHSSCTLDGAESTHSEGYYILDGEGDITHHVDLDELEAKLAWFAKMSRTEYDIFPNVDDNINWVNHIMDLGHIEADGELVSWVDDMASIDEHESPLVHNLRYIREGAGSLVSLRGA